MEKVTKEIDGIECTAIASVIEIVHERKTVNLYSKWVTPSGVQIGKQECKSLSYEKAIELYPDIAPAVIGGLTEMWAREIVRVEEPVEVESVEDMGI